MRVKKLIGGSGARIEQLGDRVVKHAPDAVIQGRWYRFVSEVQLCFAPVVISCTNNELVMKYVSGPLLNSVCTPAQLTELADLVMDRFRPFRPLSFSSASWSTMVVKCRQRMAEHAVPQARAISARLDTPALHRLMNAERSFCHGDLTLENVIVHNGRLYLIDPYFREGFYSSWLLDMGKLYFSLHHGWEESVVGRPQAINKSALFERLRRKTPDLYQTIILLELTHYVRALPYRKLKRERDIMIDVISKIWRELCFLTESD